jgi:hypothetical protein
MLTDLPVQTSIPVSDLARAQKFYMDTLELKFIGDRGGGPSYECGGSVFVLVVNANGITGQYSLITWLTGDIASEVASLRAKGVVFEDYDLPFLKTVDGIGTLGADKIAWFKDSEGNILALAQLG